MRGLSATGEMTEATLLEGVRRAARQLGWLVYHTWTSVHSAPGFPDLVLVRGPRVVFAELKGPKGKLTDKQQQWIDALRAAGQEVYVWRPVDLDGCPSIHEILLGVG